MRNGPESCRLVNPGQWMTLLNLFWSFVPNAVDAPPQMSHPGLVVSGSQPRWDQHLWQVSYRGGRSVTLKRRPVIEAPHVLHSLTLSPTNTLYLPQPPIATRNSTVICNINAYHFVNGSFELSRTLSHVLNQWIPCACSAQNSSGWSRARS